MFRSKAASVASGLRSCIPRHPMHLWNEKFKSTVYEKFLLIIKLLDRGLRSETPMYLQSF